MFYGSAADFTTYHEDRGRTVNVDWATSDIEAALLVASEWLDNMYGELFTGFRVDGFSQQRQWPRESAYTNSYPRYIFSSSEIPEKVKHATYEAAFREVQTPQSLNVDFTPDKYNSVSIEGSISVEYAQNQTIQDRQVQIKIITDLMSELLDDRKIANSTSFSSGSKRT